MMKLKKPVIVWKRGRIEGTGDLCVIKLLLPAGTMCRFNPTEFGRADEKNRCDRARVLSIFNQASRNYIRSRTRAVGALQGSQGNGTYYVVGKLVKPDYFTRSNEECAHGLHFFSARKRAKGYC